MVDCNPNFVQIIEKMREQFGELSISVFYPLYKKFYIWKNEVCSVYEKFMGVCKEGLWPKINITRYSNLSVEFC